MGGPLRPGIIVTDQTDDQVRIAAPMVPKVREHATEVRVRCDHCDMTGIRYPSHKGKTHSAGCPGCKPCKQCGGAGTIVVSV